MLHPTHKLDYFKTLKWPAGWQKNARELLEEEYERSYKHSGPAETQSNDDDDDDAKSSDDEGAADDAQDDNASRPASSPTGGGESETARVKAVSK